MEKHILNNFPKRFFLINVTNVLKMTTVRTGYLKNIYVREFTLISNQFYSAVIQNDTLY